MKVLYFDTETTGVNPTKHEIIQFSALVEIDGVVHEEINLKIQPTKWENIDPIALQTTNLTIEQLKGFELPAHSGSRIRGFFDKYVDKFNRADKFFPAGHNVQFDLDFLQSFWKTYVDPYGIGSYQNWRSLDSRVFANFLSYKGKINVPDVKLETLCKHFNIEIHAHDALSDIKATRELIQKMLQML